MSGGRGDHDLLHAYAVDAVDAAEARAFEAHLAGCGACRVELVELREALDAALVDDAALVQPPAALRARVMDALDDVAQLPPVPRLAVVPAPTSDPPEERAHQPEATDDELAGHRARRRAPRPPARTRWLQALASAAAVVVVAGAAASGYAALQYRGEATAAREAAATVAQVVSAPDAVTVAAQGDGAGAAWAGTRVVASRSVGEAVLVTSGVQDAPDGRTWQLWYVTGDAARSAGTFEDGGGDPAVLDGGVDGAEAVAVTLEPAGGSSSPTSTPVAVYPLGA